MRRTYPSGGNGKVDDKVNLTNRGGHQTSIEMDKQYVGGQAEFEQVNGGDPDVADTIDPFEYPFPSLAAWAEEKSASRTGGDISYWPLLNTLWAEFLGTAIVVFFVALVFTTVYNSAPVPAGGYLADRVSDYLLVILVTAFIFGATHATFWSESAKFNPGLSVATLVVAQSNMNGIGFNIARMLIEIGGQLMGGCLGAGFAKWVGPLVPIKTYLAAGYPFYSLEIYTANRAFFIEMIAAVIIGLVFMRIQYAHTRKTRIMTPSVLIGFAYGAAALLTYWSGSCLTFARWFGAAAVLGGNFNIATNPDTTVDAIGDNVASAGWVYYGGHLAGYAIAVVIYILFSRVTYSTSYSNRKL